jgi:hypothetical protein
LGSAILKNPNKAGVAVLGLGARMGFPDHPVYPGLCRPQAKSCLPAVHVERQRGDAHFCLEASYRCGLVGPRDGSETTVFDPLELIPQPLSIKWRRRGGPPCRAASGDGRAHDSGVK